MKSIAVETTTNTSCMFRKHPLSGNIIMLLDDTFWVTIHKGQGEDNIGSVISASAAMDYYNPWFGTVSITHD